MKKISGWLFSGSLGMPLELREFVGPRGVFANGGWELVLTGTEQTILRIGAHPLEKAKLAAEREFTARGYRLLWNFPETLQEYSKQ